MTQERWYHTIDLPDGTSTPGWFDTRTVAEKLPFGDLTGKRCLDVGTFDGFWAFHMESLGADEVLAADVEDNQIDWPATVDDVTIEAIREMRADGRRFKKVHEARQSKVERIICSIYDLDPEVHGQFDLIYVGSLLLHLRDPIRALEAVRGVCAGRMFSVDGISLQLSLTHPRQPVADLDGLVRPYWWKPNAAALRRMVESAGFEIVEGPKRFLMPAGKGMDRPRVGRAALGSRQGRELLYMTRFGDPHAYIVARPATGLIEPPGS